MLRHRIRSVLVSPSGLRILWREKMRDRFGLDSRIVDSEAMKQVRRSRGLHVKPWNHYPRLITSIDFLKRERHRHEVGSTDCVGRPGRWRTGRTRTPGRASALPDGPYS